MTDSRPLFSVCIPAYNRAAVLPQLLDSIVAQDFDDYEIVICDDCSRERVEIRAVVDAYRAKTARIRYFENEENLGFDGNIREVVARATGQYVLFMGNDDLMCPGALRTMAEAVRRYPDVGVVLRSYAAFLGTPDNIVRTARYFDGEKFFPAGVATVTTFFRRCVVIPGVVVHRDTAASFATDRFDGTTLYQIYLVANILLQRNGVSVPDIVTLYRDAGIPEFGNSAAERGRFVPNAHTIESSVAFMRGMLEIAASVDETRGVRVYGPIVRDIANYSYPIIAMHVDKGPRQFARYVWLLAKLGFWRSPMFFAYCFLLITLGQRRVDRLIERVKRAVGHTPVLGRVYTGEPGR
jgi:glycosyltransferase involved in cell wall biosynthesis